RWRLRARARHPRSPAKRWLPSRPSAASAAFRKIFDGLASGWAWLGPSAGLPRTQRTRRPADGSTARPDAARAQRDLWNVALGARVLGAEPGARRGLCARAFGR